LIIGPLVTEVSLSQYATSAEFVSYFLNIVGWIHYTLPGVFKHNPNDQVNGALWTVPWEILCYVAMSGFIVLKIVQSRLQTLLIVLAFMSCGLLVQYFQLSGPGFPPQVHTVFLSRGAQVFTAFLLGIVFYQNRHLIRYSYALLTASVIVCLLSAFFLENADVESVTNRFFALPAIVYITVFLGLTAIPLPEIFKKGDYSYGIYLYHSPFLQLWVLVFPILASSGLKGAFTLFLLALAVVTLSQLCLGILLKSPSSLNERSFPSSLERGV
jgi:peptidoglycan/LPS O-acetylase OafA/YrhL